MIDNIRTLAEKHHTAFFGFIKCISNKPKKLLIAGDLLEIYNQYEVENHSNSELKNFIEKIQSSVSLGNTVFLEIRIRTASTLFYKVNTEELVLEETDPSEFLINKEICANSSISNNILNLNFKPFNINSPKVRDVKYIGNGVEYLNRFLSSKMFTDSEKWKSLLFDFIRLHKLNNEQLILNDRIRDLNHLYKQLDSAIEFLSSKPGDTPFHIIKHSLQDYGFECGLGNTAELIKENLILLDQLLNSPDHTSLMKFISAIPMVSKIVIVSPHGYFAQEGVLGLPDTGGQVVYILDQVKALEKVMAESLKVSGLEVIPKIIVLTRLIPNAGDTNCNKRFEKINGTLNSWILRVPFRTNNKNITDNWISRFEIWPYIEEFSDDAFVALSAEFGGRPDLVIGNYSDGNLAAYLLSRKFKVTQCNIAHALEKSKYLFSALYWYDLEKFYNFSLQFTADLIAINSADFIISSSFQEIAGTDNSIGQYESYQHFTMPGLYRVTNGVDLNHVKFNIVSPGVNPKNYFPYTQKDFRIKETTSYLNKLLFGNYVDPETIGVLEDPEKIPLFTMARLDRIKNITFLAELFGESKELQKIANLIIVAGKIDENQTHDNEEKEQIRKMHYILKTHNLYDKVRWIGKLFPKDEAGEVYRLIADRKGIFIQPALFEGFGLTVLEAMVSGLPCFATKYGGPLEIIQNKINGFHINPVDKEETSEIIINFIDNYRKNPSVWDTVSQNSIKRVNEKYNWKLYSERLLSLSKIYGFWKYSTNLDHKDMDAYLDIIFHTIFRPGAQKLKDKHS